MAKKRSKRRAPKKTYRFQLTMPGIAGITVVCFCLFLWMFLLGIWAGQTFLLPTDKSGVVQQSRESKGNKKQVETLFSSAKKKPVATEQ